MRAPAGARRRTPWSLFLPGVAIIAGMAYAATWMRFGPYLMTLAALILFGLAIVVQSQRRKPDAKSVDQGPAATMSDSGREYVLAGLGALAAIGALFLGLHPNAMKPQTEWAGDGFAATALDLHQAVTATSIDQRSQPGEKEGVARTQGAGTESRWSTNRATCPAFLLSSDSTTFSGIEVNGIWVRWPERMRRAAARHACGLRDPSKPASVLLRTD